MLKLSDEAGESYNEDYPDFCQDLKTMKRRSKRQDFGELKEEITKQACHLIKKC